MNTPITFPLEPFACLFALIAFTSAAHAEKLYYTEPGFDDGIRELNKDGTGHDFAINMPNVDPRGLAVDEAAGKFYYSRAGDIYRADYDGSDEEFLFASGGSVPTDVELDLTAGKVYWSISGPLGGIRRGNLDGTGSVDVLVTQGILDPLYLDLTPLDPAIRADDVTGIEIVGGLVYWANGQGLNTMPLGGVSSSTDPANLFSVSGANDIHKIAIDSIASEVYWTNNVGSKVQKAGLDGTALTTLSDRGFGRPTGIALDLAGGDVFWADTLGTGGKGEILRVSTDGSTPVAMPEILFDFGNAAYDPYDLELATIPEPATALLAVAGMICLSLRRRRRS